MKLLSACSLSVYNLFSLQPEGTFSKHYEMQPGELGRGRFTVVKKAVKKTNADEAVAVKEIYKGSLDSEELASVYQEVSIMKVANKHPNCIHLLEVIDTPADIYLVMELATGGEMFARITAKHHFSESEAAKCFEQVLSALRFLHSRGVAHRDIKPENILYLNPSDASPIKICDFGLGKRLQRAIHRGGKRARMKSLCGSPTYVAPEMFHGKYGCECDVWSAGVILYVMLSGTFPWKMEDGLDVMLEQVKKGEFDFPEADWSGVSDDAKNLIRAMLQVDVAKRQKISDILDGAWLQRHREGALPDCPMPGAQKRLRRASLMSGQQEYIDTIAAF